MRPLADRRTGTAGSHAASDDDDQVLQVGHAQAVPAASCRSCCERTVPIRCTRLCPTVAWTVVGSKDHDWRETWMMSSLSVAVFIVGLIVVAFGMPTPSICLTA